MSPRCPVTCQLVRRNRQCLYPSNRIFHDQKQRARIDYIVAEVHVLGF